jgi:cytochrome c peroxidase
MFHADPVAGLTDYKPQAILATFSPAKADWTIANDPAEINAIKQAVTGQPRTLTGPEADAILAFLDSLTDPTAIAGRLGIPASVPSGLPIDR